MVGNTVTNESGVVVPKPEDRRHIHAFNTLAVDMFSGRRLREIMMSVSRPSRPQGRARLVRVLALRDSRCETASLLPQPRSVIVRYVDLT